MKDPPATDHLPISANSLYQTAPWLTFLRECDSSGLFKNRIASLVESELILCLLLPSTVPSTQLGHTYLQNWIPEPPEAGRNYPESGRTEKLPWQVCKNHEEWTIKTPTQSPTRLSKEHLSCQIQLWLTYNCWVQMGGLSSALAESKSDFFSPLHFNFPCQYEE